METALKLSTLLKIHKFQMNKISKIHNNIFHLTFPATSMVRKIQKPISKTTVYLFSALILHFYFKMSRSIFLLIQWPAIWYLQVTASESYECHKRSPTNFHICNDIAYEKPAKLLIYL